MTSVASLSPMELAPYAIPPAAPRTLEETGLPFLFLVELTTKLLFRGGSLRLADLTDRSKLTRGVLDPVLSFMRQERLCELFSRSTAEMDVSFVLTDLGRKRADEFLAKSQYAGPAPVPLDAYLEACADQRVTTISVSREDITRAYSGIAMDPQVADQLGAAMNSGRAMFLFGPAGSGKTFIAERLVAALSGQILIPHAIEIDGEVITLFDPLVHQPLDLQAFRTLELERQFGDQRWILCRRPFVLAGGELTLAMLDLQFDAATRFYSAPPQLKANGGVLVIDDLGRQQVQPQALMNRWIVPLDRSVDYLTLHTGKRVKVPFDAVVVFSSNFRPEELADDALIRRLGYKIFIGPLDERHYREVFKHTCAKFGVPVSDALISEIIRRHVAEDRPLLACIPRDLIGPVRDVAKYRGTAPGLEQSVLDWAWANRFGLSPGSPKGGPRSQ